MTRLRTGLAALALASAVATTTAFAADPIETRKATMKAIGGAFGGVLLKMLKGEIPYDAAQANEAYAKITAAAASIDVDAAFPAGSDKGGDTAASPKIWKDMAGFKQAMADFRAALPAQAGNVGKGVDGLKVAVPAIGRTCKACHDGYRLEKN